jgi:hypothetical protein
VYLAFLPTFQAPTRGTGIGYHYHTLLDSRHRSRSNYPISPPSVCSRQQKLSKFPSPIAHNMIHSLGGRLLILDSSYRWALEGNAERILQSIREAKAAGASLVLGGEGGKIC